MRLAAKWPIDKRKNEKRNYKYFLEKQIGWICGLSHERLESHRDDRPTLSPSELPMSYHDANMRGRVFKDDMLSSFLHLALRELINDEHRKRWPSTHYRSGIFGLSLQQLREANTEKAREHMGLTESRWQSFKAMFWRS